MFDFILKSFHTFGFLEICAQCDTDLFRNCKTRFFFSQETNVIEKSPLLISVVNVYIHIQFQLVVKQ